MKKILFISATNNSLKGTEKALSVLMSGLEMEYEIHYLGVEKEAPEIKNNNITFHFLNISKKNITTYLYKPFHFFYLVLGINDALNKIQPDIVVTSLDEINIATGLLISKHPRKKFIGTIHTNPETCLTVIKKYLAKMVFPKFTQIICTSSGVKNSIDSIIKNLNSVVIYNPTEIKQLPAKKISILRNIIFIGNINFHKGIHHLIRVINHLEVKKRPRLDILGEGPIKEDLITYCQKNKLKDWITFHGIQENISSFIQKSDALILPTYSEAFALVLVESLKNGIPVIASDADFGPREILNIKKEIGITGILKTESGILIKPPTNETDKISNLYTDKLTPFEELLLLALTERKGFAIDESLCDRFDSDEIVKQWKKILHKL